MLIFLAYNHKNIFLLFILYIALLVGIIRFILVGDSKVTEKLSVSKQTKYNNNHKNKFIF